MRESRSLESNDEFRALGLAFLMAFTAIISLPAVAAAAPGSAGIAAAKRERYRTKPLSVWVTPAAGRIGNSLAAGGDLRFALENGWGASAGFTVGEEFCIFCGHAPEQFGAGALLAGFRGVDRFGYVSIAAGPGWGWGKRRDRASEENFEDDDVCEGFLCWDTDHPTVSDRGFGMQVQMQAALTGRYLGIGAQIQIIYIPRHVYAGVSLILPIGLIK